MQSYWGDITFRLYVVIELFGLYVFILFAWWFFRAKKLPLTFLYIMILILGVDLRTFGDMSRLIAIHTGYMKNIKEFVHPHFEMWDIRLIPTLIGILGISFHITYRAFWLRPKRKQEFHEELEKDSHNNV
jgi:uncharacterized membrane protein